MTEAKPKMPDAKTDAKGPASPPPADFMRETVESVVIAFVLAFLFRTFVAEAFVIPTGSMATTLMGAHKDLECANCGYWFQASASSEFDENGVRLQYRDERDQQQNISVIGVGCPNCGFPMDTSTEKQYPSYKGDRIIVSKFGTQEPQRWDVTVFRFPEKAATNYIKRLVGLPGESIQIRNGDLYAKRNDQPDSEYRILRKPPEVVLSMLRDVYDNAHVADWMTRAGWPPRWQPCPAELESLLASGWPNDPTRWPWPGRESAAGSWVTKDGYRTFSTDGASSGEAWLRYQHFLAAPENFSAILSSAPDKVREATQSEYRSPRFDRSRAMPELPHLVQDHSGYNINVVKPSYAHKGGGRAPEYLWVGDLAVECKLTSEKSGYVVLELIKAGHRFHCRLDLANRSVQLAIDGGRRSFDGASGQAGAATATAQSSLPASESFDVLFANIDSQLSVWIDGELLTFDGPTTYDLPVAQNDHRPADLSPVGIGAKGAKVKVEQLRLARDVFYLDYQSEPTPGEATRTYKLADEENDAEDQFFMLGDNSAQSSDARAWDDHWVKRDLLIGKALFIYWPHSWDSPVPFTPNWKRMKFIK